MLEQIIKNYPNYLLIGIDMIALIVIFFFLLLLLFYLQKIEKRLKWILDETKQLAIEENYDMAIWIANRGLRIACKLWIKNLKSYYFRNNK